MSYDGWLDFDADRDADPWKEMKKSALRTSRWILAGIVGGVVTSFATGDLPFLAVVVGVSVAYGMGVIADLTIKMAFHEPDTLSEE